MARIAKKTKGKRGRPSKNVHVVEVKASANTVKDLRPGDSDFQYFGAEPDVSKPLNLITAYNWYSHFYGRADAKDFILSYLESTNSPKLKQFRKVAENQIVQTAGWIARMAHRGLVLTAQQTEFYEKSMDRMLATVQTSQPVAAEDLAPETVNKANVQEIMRERAGDAAGFIDALFDSFFASNDSPTVKEFFTPEVTTPIAELKLNNILPQHVPAIIKRWEKLRNEFEAALKGKDEQLVEGYASYSKKQMKNKLAFAEEVISQLNSYIALKAATKKVRVAKPKSVEKIVSRVKYLKAFKDDAQKLDLVSISPTKLHGATECFLFDTKKRKLTYVVADEYSKTLSVKGTKLIGFDKNKSMTKTIRKPGEQINEIMNAGRPATRKFFDNIRAVEVTTKGKVNSDTLILKVW